MKIKLTRKTWNKLILLDLKCFMAKPTDNVYRLFSILNENKFSLKNVAMLFPYYCE